MGTSFLMFPYFKSPKNQLILNGWNPKFLTGNMKFNIKIQVLSGLIALSFPAIAAPVTVYENNFASYDDFASCVWLDKNNDGICWEWDTYNGKGYAFCYGTDPTEDMFMQTSANDWIVTPEISLQKGHSYQMSVNTQLLYDPEEKFECKWGTDYHVENLTGTAIPPTVMDESFANAKTVEGNRIDIIADGKYRFAYHMMSEAYSDGVALHSLKIVDLGLTSELGNEPVQIFSEQFESSASFIPFTVVDYNGDSCKWTYNNSKGCAMYTNSSKNSADDHLITPAIPMQVGRNYRLKFKAEADSYDEKIEVLLGKSNKPSDLSTVLVEPTNINKKQILTLGNDLFTVDSSGDYYISFHAISDPDKFKLYVDDIEVWDTGSNGQSETVDPEPEDKSLPLPYSADMTDPKVFAEYTVVDANYDGTTWKYDDIVKTTHYTYSKTENANDWLITPDLKFEAGKTYRLSVTAASRGLEYPEKFEAKLGHGKDISSYTTTLIAPTEIIMDLNEPYMVYQSGPVSMEETSVWNVGIHAISAANMSDLLVYKIEVSEVNVNAPMAVTDLKAAADPKGELKATISFKAPTHNLGGEALSVPLTKIDVYRDATLIESVEYVTPGDAVSVIDSGNGMKEGVNQYTVIPFIGDNEGNVAQINLYIGCDIPKKLTGVRGEDLGATVKLWWNQPDTKGVKGGVVYPDLVTYNIYEVITEDLFGQQYISGYNFIKNVTELSTEIETPNMNRGGYEMVHFAIEPQTSAGKGDMSYVNFLQGTPIALPFEETFPGGKPKTFTSFDTDCVDEDSALYASSHSSDGDNGAIGFVSYEGDKYMALFMAKMATKDAGTPTLEFDARNYIGNNTLKVWIMTPDNVQHEVATFRPASDSDDYTHYKVDLSDYKDALWTRLIFAVEFPIYVDPDYGNELNLDAVNVYDADNSAIIEIDDSIEEEGLFPCDVYSIDGRLLRRNALSLEGLSGIVVVKGHKIILK